MNVDRYTLTGVIKNKGKLTIKAGTFIAKAKNSLLYNEGETHIIGGNAKGTITTVPTIDNAKNGKIVIYNGTITSENSSAITNCGILQIQKATIQNKSKSVACIVTKNQGNTSILTGNIISENNTALFGEANTNIIIGQNSTQEKTNEPVIIAKQYGIDTQSALQYNDGKITASVAIRSGSTITTENDRLYYDNNANKQTVYLIPTASVAKVGNTLYTTLEDALRGITTQEPVTIEILKDIHESVEILENMNVVLDLGGHNVYNGAHGPIGTFVGRIRNKGTLKIISGYLENNQDTIIYNEGNLTITGNVRMYAVDRNCIYNQVGASITATTDSVIEISSSEASAIVNHGEISLYGSSNGQINITNNRGTIATIVNYGKMKGHAIKIMNTGDQDEEQIAIYNQGNLRELSYTIQGTIKTPIGEDFNNI